MKWLVIKMIKEGKFGLSEAIILLILSNIARIFLPYPRFLAELGGPAAWMTPLAGWPWPWPGFI
jgi:hypothetical protein